MDNNLIKSMALSLSLLIGSSQVHAQDLKKQQKSQKAAVEQAYKQHKVSEKEYYKLLREQEIIEDMIAKAEADEYMDTKEKNAIYGKLQRAKKRLRRYRTNREVF